MKCPKCGFNSFESYDSCKKCFIDLSGYKQTYSITSMVIPREAKEKLSAGLRLSENENMVHNNTSETNNDIFAFDLPEDNSSPSPENQSKDPFDFDEPTPQSKPSNKTKFDDDMFSDLLESTSQSDESPFGAAQNVAITAAPAKAVSSSEPGEFDLENFSWDDTPADDSVADSKEGADDFDSLFGGTNENKK